MRSASPHLLTLVGLLLLLAFSAAGIFNLFYPPPPSALRGTGSAWLCMEGVALMTVANAIAFFLGLLTTANDVPKAISIWKAIFLVLSNGINLFGKGPKG